MTEDPYRSFSTREPAGGCTRPRLVSAYQLVRLQPSPLPHTQMIANANATDSEARHTASLSAVVPILYRRRLKVR